MSSTLAVIGGTGMNQWPGLDITERLVIATPYGPTSAPLLRGRVYGVEAIFLARHGEGHKIPPHRINYRAIAAVGAIAPWFEPGTLAVPDDVIDYSYGREHTFSDGSAGSELKHVEFNAAYAAGLRAALLAAGRAANVAVHDGGTMGVTQGPRLESPAEIRRLKNDGCAMVGMTGMPEAALAAELGLEYACLAVSVNWGAGIGSGDIHGEIHRTIEAGMSGVRAVLAGALPALAGRAAA
jgi:purine nucleoside phosphorylase